jgi:DNA-binding winged helix-turn-helix (wHTH) protein
MGTIRFGECVWDPESRELFRRGRSVHLQPKTYRLLEVLFERRPAAVSKEELIEKIWPKVFVGDGNLARLVADLREAIGDDGEDSLIRTIRGFGYAFRAEPEAKAAPPSGGPVFKLLWRDREIALSPGENMLGRDPRSVARIDVASVSRQHARIRIEGEDAVLEDLGSKNGTQVDGRRVKQRASLRDGAEIRIGTARIVFRRFEPGTTTETVKSH